MTIIIDEKVEEAESLNADICTKATRLPADHVNAQINMQTRPLEDLEDDQEAQEAAVDDVPDEATPIIIS